jgi:hypothetical protein
MGPITIQFNDNGQKITYNLPKNIANGMIWGDRQIYHEGASIYEDHGNNLKAVVMVNSKKNGGRFAKQSKKIDEFGGIIYKKLLRFEKEETKKKKDDTKLDKLDDIEEEICEIRGSWLDKLTIDNEEWWNINDQVPVRSVTIPNCLQSDPRYREDLISLFRGNEKLSQEWKLRMEI